MTRPLGFPSPAEDYFVESLDLNKHLIKNPPSTYFLRVSGNSIPDLYLHSNDILIVDRSLDPNPGNTVISYLDEQFIVKKLNPNEEVSLVWGVVTHVIHAL